MQWFVERFTNSGISVRKVFTLGAYTLRYKQSSSMLLKSGMVSRSSQGICGHDGRKYVASHSPYQDAFSGFWKLQQYIMITFAFSSDWKKNAK